MTLYNYTIIIVLMVLGLYIIINDKNLIKKMIGVSVFQASVLLFYISLGYIKVPCLLYWFQIFIHIAILYPMF